MSLTNWILDTFFPTVLLGFASLLTLAALLLVVLGVIVRLATRRWEGFTASIAGGVVCLILALFFVFLNWDWGPPLFVSALFLAFPFVGVLLLILAVVRKQVAPAVVGAVFLLLDVGLVLLFSTQLLQVGQIVLSTRFLYAEWLALLGLVPLLLLFSFRDVQTWHILLILAVVVGGNVLLWLFGPAALLWLGGPPGYQTLILLGVSLLLQAICYLPLLFLPARRSLAGLGPYREWVAVSLRCLLVIFLALALADPQINDASQETTVLFLIDRSLSVPEEHTGDLGPSGLPLDHRWLRIREFVDQSVRTNSRVRPKDRAGLILFGRRPRLELPPAAVPRFTFGDSSGAIDGGYTDIAGALKLALASFPENTGKRIVLFSDGNENLGMAEEQVRKAQLNGVQIDVVPLATGVRDEYEVLVQSIEAPSRVEQGAKVPLRVLIRSMSPNPVPGVLRIVQKSGDEEVNVVEEEAIVDGKKVMVPGQRVVLRQGLNVFSFKQPSTKEERSYTYEATFDPQPAVGGDRVQNNKAITHVIAHGQRRILLLEGVKGEHKFLLEQLRKTSNEEFTIESEVVDRLPVDPGALGAKLSEYDCLIMANVAASDVTEEGVKVDPDKPLPGVLTKEQQEVIRSTVHDQGMGLVMIGGDKGFGAGGWQDTPIEKALPVDCDIKAIEVEGKGGLVMVMHASEMSQGNFWQQEIAKLAIKKLSQHDEVAVLYYDYQKGVIPHIAMQKIGDNREKLLAKVDTLQPGDMPDFGPAMQASYDALVKGRTDDNKLATKHVIVISDGDPAPPTPAMMAQIKAAGITVTTVGVATHDPARDKALADMAVGPGGGKGRYYKVMSPKSLPQIYTKETRLISQSYIHESKKGLALGKGPAFSLGPLTEGIGDVPPVYGLVRTSVKSSPLVDQYLLWSDNKGQQFPVLAFWPYGLGKSAAFTSDALVKWDVDWTRSPIYTKFWQQVLKSCMRPVESRKMSIATEYRDGKMRVTVEMRDDQGKLVGPSDDRRFGVRVNVSAPGAGVDEKGLPLEMKSVGVWEGEFKAENAGSYFVTAMRVEKRKKDGKEEEVFTDRASGGLTVPYSPEFGEVATNFDLLKRLASETDGRVYAETKADLDRDPERKQFTQDSVALQDAAASADAFRPTPPRFQSPNPIWWWLVVLVGVLLFFDVAVRRIAVEPIEVLAKAKAVVGGLFGAAQAEKKPEYFERLKSRKAQVEEKLEKSKASRRFDETETVAVPPPPGADAAPPPPRPSVPSKRPKPGGVAPDQPSKEPEDYASRLMRAKRKAMEGKEKPKDEE